MCSEAYGKCIKEPLHFNDDGLQSRLERELASVDKRKIMQITHAFLIASCHVDFIPSLSQCSCNHFWLSATSEQDSMNLGK